MMWCNVVGWVGCVVLGVSKDCSVIIFKDQAVDSNHQQHHCENVRSHKCFKMFLQKWINCLKYSSLHLYVKHFTVSCITNETEVNKTCRLQCCLHFVWCIFICFLYCNLDCGVIECGGHCVTWKVKTESVWQLLVLPLNTKCNLSSRISVTFEHGDRSSQMLETVTFTGCCRMTSFHIEPAQDGSRHLLLRKWDCITTFLEENRQNIFYLFVFYIITISLFVERFVCE
jgi:hypothetical protein